MSEATIDPEEALDDLAPWPRPAYPPPLGPDAGGPDTWGPDRANGYAVAALLAGIAGLALFRFPIVGMLAVALGCVGVRQLRRSPGTQRGNAIAIAAIVLGVVAMGLGVALVLAGRSGHLAALPFVPFN